METQTLLNYALGAGLAVMGWLGRELWGAVKELKEDLKRIEVALPTEYVKKDEFKETLVEVKEMLNKIFDKLDGKADKK